MSYASKLKKSLFQCIKTLNQNRSEYCHAPGRDYTRNRKADFSSIIKAVLCFGGKSLNKELYEIFGFSPDTLTPSAFIQQRSKIKPEAFEELFRSFNRANKQIQLFHGYRLLAIDGSLLHTPTNKMDTDSLHYNRTSCFNLYNINAFYDLNNHTYTDVLIQKFKQRNEHAAFVHMVDNLDSSVPALITADRGYESYNNLAHVQESGHKFLIRMKDKNSNGILQRFKLSDGEFDLPIHLTLTRKQTNDLKSDPSVICIGNSRKLDFLPYSYKKTDPTVFYSLDFRIVRVKISDDCYEILATNLDKREFTPSLLKEIYAMRWGIETSFRKLKYIVGLTALHSKKSEHILQEIFARLIMYNFSELVTSHIAIRKKKRKHLYRINFSIAVHACRNLLLGRYAPKNVEAVIGKNILPIRPNQSNPRPKHRRIIPLNCFTYRVA